MEDFRGSCGAAGVAATPARAGASQDGPRADGLLDGRARVPLTAPDAGQHESHAVPGSGGLGASQLCASVAELAQYDRAVKYLSLNPSVEAQLWTINRELTGNFPVQVDDEAIRSFSSYPEGPRYVRPARKASTISVSIPRISVHGRMHAGARIRLSNQE